MFFTRQALWKFCSCRAIMFRLGQSHGLLRSRNGSKPSTTRPEPTNNTSNKEENYEGITCGWKQASTLLLQQLYLMTPSSTSTNVDSQQAVDLGDGQVKDHCNIGDDGPSCNNNDNDQQETILAKLSKLLGLKKSQATRILKEYPKLCEISNHLIEERIAFLEGKNVMRHRIANLPWLLLLQSEEVKKQVEEIQNFLSLDFNCAIELLKVPGINHLWMEQVRNVWLADHDECVRQGCDTTNRVDCIAQVLECEPCVVAAMMAKVPNIAVNPNLEQVLVILELYLRHVGFSYEEIIARSVLLQTHSYFPCLWYFLFVFVPNFYHQIVFFLCVYVLLFLFYSRWL